MLPNLDSIMVLPGKLVAGVSGFVVDGAGYPLFFVYTAAMGIPAVLLVLLLMAHSRRAGAHAALARAPATAPRAAEERA
jgi:PAT family beta-lactamase induction signal transducer AmpG